ncbi:MAG: hypothetical protein ACJARX_001051, partial [Psychroserpens sp.]
SSDDDGNAPDITPDTTDDLVGTWIANDLSIISDVTFTLVGQPVETRSEAVSYATDYNITFNESSNTYMSTGSYDLENSITFLGETAIEDLEDFEFLENGTWSQDGTDLLISFTEENVTFQIEELTETNLTIRLNETETITEDGILYTTNTEIIATFTRQ